MDTNNRAFLDLLPAPYLTLDTWRTHPPFPLLGSGCYRVDLAESDYEQFIEFVAEGLQTFDQYELDELFVLATKSYSIYCQITDKGVAESDVVRKDFSRLSYQLCLNFRDAIVHLDTDSDDDAEFGFQFAVEIYFYSDPE